MEVGAGAGAGTEVEAGTGSQLVIPLVFINVINLVAGNLIFIIISRYLSHVSNTV